MTQKPKLVQNNIITLKMANIYQYNLLGQESLYY